MIKTVLTALRMVVALTLITGVLYPLAITLLAQALFPVQANGSLIVAANRVVGSALIGQANQEARYFWPRPSAVNYMDDSAVDALGTSGASNLGPTNAALAAQVGRRDDAFRAANGLAAGAPVPADMRFASGSGLDPHISPAAAYAQIDRVAHARGIAPTDVAALVEQHVEAAQFGLLGSPRVNVLRLNLALDGVQ